MGTSYAVTYHVESTLADGSVDRDSWLRKWGRPSKKTLRALMSRRSDVVSAKVVHADGRTVVSKTTS